MAKEIDKATVAALVREVLFEHLAQGTKQPKKLDPSGIILLAPQEVNVTEEDRLHTGNTNDKVYCHDLLKISESPRLGCGLMVMEETTFDWQLDYDEIDYIIEGTLTVTIAGRKITAGAGEVIFIPKGSTIKFGATEKVRFLYVTYPADWQSKQ